MLFIVLVLTALDIRISSNLSGCRDRDCSYDASSIILFPVGFLLHIFRLNGLFFNVIFIIILSIIFYFLLGSLMALITPKKVKDKLSKVNKKKFLLISLVLIVIVVLFPKPVSIQNEDWSTIGEDKFCRSYETSYCSGITFGEFERREGDYNLFTGPHCLGLRFFTKINGHRHCINIDSDLVNESNYENFMGWIAG